MGGCKCAYSSCKKSSDGVTHFFHFPVKDQQRCNAWVEQSKRSEFNLLTQQQLKNKVICQFHFTEKMFLNYKHDRLIHKAIPTIEFYDTDVEVVAEVPAKDPLECQEMQISPPSTNIERSLPVKQERKTLYIDVPPLVTSPSKEKEKNVNNRKVFVSTPYSLLKSNTQNSSMFLVDDSTITFDPDKSSNNSTIVNKTVVKNKVQCIPRLKYLSRNDLIKKQSSPAVVKETENNLQNTPNQAESQIIPPAVVRNVEPTNGKSVKVVSKQTISAEESKKIFMQCVIDRMNKFDAKERTLKAKNGSIMKVSKQRTLRKCLSNNMLLQSASASEAVISQTPILKKTLAMGKVQLIDEQLRRINKDCVIKNRFIKLNSSGSPIVIQKDMVQENEYMKLILKTQDEMAEIKKILQKAVIPPEAPATVMSHNEPGIPKFSKEALYAAVVPYLSAEVAKVVHSEMFPSLAIIQPVQVTDNIQKPMEN